MRNEQLETFVNSALESACQRVFLAPPGTATATLGRAAFKVGQIIAANQLCAELAFSRLMEAAADRFIQAAEARAAIRRAFRKAVPYPKGLDDIGGAGSDEHPNKGEAEAAKQKASALAIWHETIPLRASSVASEYWQNYLGLKLPKNVRAVRFHVASNAVVFPVQQMASMDMVGVQRVFLNRDGVTVDALGNSIGSAVYFKGESGAKTLYLCDDVEPAASIYEALRYEAHVAASVGASALGEVRIPNSIEHVIIVSRVGSEAAALEASRQIAERHDRLKVAVLGLPKEFERGADANDVLRFGSRKLLRDALANGVASPC